MHFCIFWHFLPTHIFWAQDRIIRILWWMWHCGTVKFLQPKLHCNLRISAWRTLAASAALPQRSADTWAAQKRSPIFNMCCTETEAQERETWWDIRVYHALICVICLFISCSDPCPLIERTQHQTTMGHIPLVPSHIRPEHVVLGEVGCDIVLKHLEPAAAIALNIYNLKKWPLAESH